MKIISLDRYESDLKLYVNEGFFIFSPQGTYTLNSLGRRNERFV